MQQQHLCKVLSGRDSFSGTSAHGEASLGIKMTKFLQKKIITAARLFTFVPFLTCHFQHIVLALSLLLFFPYRWVFWILWHTGGGNGGKGRIRKLSNGRLIPTVDIGWFRLMSRLYWGRLAVAMGNISDLIGSLVANSLLFEPCIWLYFSTVFCKWCILKSARHVDPLHCKNNVKLVSPWMLPVYLLLM